MKWELLQKCILNAHILTLLVLRVTLNKRCRLHVKREQKR